MAADAADGTNGGDGIRVLLDASGLLLIPSDVCGVINPMVTSNRHVASHNKRISPIVRSFVANFMIQWCVFVLKFKGCPD